MNYPVQNNRLDRDNFLWTLHAYVFCKSLLGTLLLVASQSEDSDALWTVSNDSFPFQVQLMEAHVSAYLLNISSFMNLFSISNQYKN